jgi:hypothetical protein
MQINRVKQQKILQTGQVKTQKKSEPVDVVTTGSSHKDDPDFLNMKNLASLASSEKNRELKKFYKENQTPIHVAGGALLGAGIAHVAGVPGGEVLAAAGSGAIAGWFADDPKSALFMAGGAIIGTAIATLAGLPAAAVVSAAGTGTFVGWMVG